MKCTSRDGAKFHGLIALALWASFACGSDSSGSPDAGPIDSGVTFLCGDAACVQGDQYCLQEATGPCTAQSGQCAAGEAVCTDNGMPGCGPVQLSCIALPMGCTSCPCLIASDACGSEIVNFTCSSSGGRLDVRCPF